MLAQDKKDRLSLEDMAKNIYINEAVFIGLIVLCFLGDVMGEISDRAVIIYWILMAPVFFISVVVIEKAQVLTANKTEKNNVRFNLVLWSSALISILVVLFLWHSGALVTQAVGLVIHVILAHTMFVTGSVLGFRFYLIGLLLFIMLWFTILMEGTVAVTLMFAVPLMVMGLYFEKHYFFPYIKKRELFVSKINGMFYFLEKMGKKI